jgi:hypothetical protein
MIAIINTQAIYNLISSTVAAMKNVFPGICALSKGKYVYDL